MRRHRLLLVGSMVAAGVLASAAACTSSDRYVVVTVDARAAVHDAKAISVALSNTGTTRMDNLELRDHAFPVTFSISAPGRTGDLAITIDALDANGAVVGHGSAATTVDAAVAKVMLDSTDFVVNTDYAGDQFPTDNFEAGGFQVAAQPDGTWTAVFADGCPTNSCSLFARRFDKTGKALDTQAAAGTNAFTVTARPTSSVATPAVASGQATSVVLWNFSDVGTSTASGVACRALDATGRLGNDQTTLDTLGAYVVSVVPLASGSFAASWRILNASVIDELHTAIVKPDCSITGPVQLIAKGNVVADLLHRGAVASSAERVLFAWSTNGDLHARVASSAGVFATVDTMLVPKTATDDIESVRVAAAPGGGFVVGLRWADTATATGNGRIELRQLSAAGALVGGPALVTDKASSESDASHAFTMASRADGTVLVAWHTCGTLGDGNQCGVFGRIMRATGEAVTDAFAIPTTTAGDQQLPSVAALPDGFVAVWSDASAKAPDISGRSVRARILYPPSLPPTPPGGD